MINRYPKKTHKPPVLCINCRNSKANTGDDLNVYSKEDWICLGFKIIDLLDGEVSHYTCRKARKEVALCGPDAVWFSVKP